MKKTIGLAIILTLLITPISAQAATRTIVSETDIKVTNLLYKYQNDPKIYSGTVGCRYVIPSWELLINHFPYKPIIVTVDDNFSVPDCQGTNFYNRPISGTVFKQSNNPTIGVIIGGDVAGTDAVYYFPSIEDFYDKGYSLKNIQVFSQEIDLKDLTVTQQFTRPHGTAVKYANSPVIYDVVENRQIRPYASLEMFMFRHGSLNRVVTLPANETYPVEGRVSYGMKVVKGSGPKVYVNIMGQLRPFASLAAFYRHGLLLDDIVTMPDGEIGGSNTGDPLY